MRTSTTRFALAAIALASFAWQGCSTDNFATAPGTPDLRPAVRQQPTYNEGWTVVASEKFNPGVDAVAPPLTGSRYTLTFSQGSLSSATTIQISERDPKIVDVKLDPDGAKFDAPVSLTIDYSGTANDPASPFFTGSAPQVHRFDPSTSSWSEVPGTDYPATKTYVAQLSGFSRYAMTDGMQDGSAQTGHPKDSIQ
jgi:hypothetical protein